MNLSLASQVSLTRRGQGWRRRDFLRAAAGTAGLSGLAGSWVNLSSAFAEPLKQRRMACIVLWMQGGPSQFETFSPKPGHENGGSIGAIDTNVSGIQISANLPQLAQQADKLAIVRSMTGREGSHPRATSVMHTSYLPTASIKHPSLGANVAHQLADREFELPSYIQIGGRGFNFNGGGLLGVEYDPFTMADPESMPNNTQLSTSSDRYGRRLGLLDRLEADYAETEGRQVVADHRKVYDKAARMILSPDMQAFDISKESDSQRDAYGRTTMGSACLLARRLVESGVTFIEVDSGGWDTHDNYETRTANLGKAIDQPIAFLLQDLADRGLLDTTMVLWMGEFGRTPRINPRGGRDHYPRAFNVALAGAGIPGGQVIGATDAGGVDVVGEPIKVNDLFQTIYRRLGINPAIENMSSIGRPIKLVDGGEPIAELV